MIKLRLPLLLMCFVLTLTTPFCASASYSIKPGAALTSENWQHLKLADFVKFSPGYFGTADGKRMNSWDKVSFKMLKIRMKKELKKNPDILVSEFYSKTKQKRLAWGWWVLISLGALLLLYVILSALALGALPG
jgi:hypothetical protein